MGGVDVTTLREKIEVMQAAERGEEIEHKPVSPSSTEWKITVCPRWDWINWIYRVKIRPREIWLAENRTGLWPLHTRDRAVEAAKGTLAGAVIRFVEVERIPVNKD
jgi:hypothetical protein